ncbi:MAG: tyrosine-type recombinase/integrase [Desulfobacteraceae bacterium]|nr:tyrosine-type recombinase/integrase [Desulfobacteraceae bacterium]
MGMIYKRKYKDKSGNTREGGIWWIKYYKDGKPYYESAKSKKETDAKRLLKKREGEISEGKLPGIYYDRTRFEDLEKMFLRDRRINNKSVKDAKKRLNHLRPFFEGIKASNIKTDRIAKYVDERLNEGAANATINRELAALRRMLNLGYRAERVARVPHIPMLEENNIKTGYLEDFEFEALREALPLYLKGFLTFGYLTGWRKEEVAGLTWARVDLKGRTVSLGARQTKNKEARHMYMEDGLLSIMFEQWASKEDACNYVFHREGQRIKDFRGAWNDACREAGIGYGYKASKRYTKEWQEKGLTEGPIYHDLRRTAVRQMDKAGVSRKVAMMRTGHKTESVYNRYNIGTDADLKNAAQQLEAYRNGSENNVETGTLTPEQQLLMLSFLLMSKNATVTNTVTTGNSNEKRANRHVG